MLRGQQNTRSISDKDLPLCWSHGFGNREEIRMHFHSRAQTGKTDCSRMVDRSANTDGRKKKVMVLQEWMFTNANVLSFAFGPRAPGANVICFFQ